MSRKENDKLIAFGNLLVNEDVYNKVMAYKNKLGVRSALEAIRILLHSHPEL